MIYLVISIVVIFILNKQFGLYDILNPFVLFIYYYLGFLFIALSWLENFVVNKGVSIETNTIDTILIFLLLLVFFGLIVNLYLKKYKFNKKFDFRQIELSPLKSEQVLSGFILFFIGGFFWLIFIIKNGGEIPFLADDVENFRIEARKGVGGITILSSILLTYSGTILAMNNRLNPTLKLIIIFLTFFLILSFGNRGPAIMYLLILFIGYVLYKKIKIKMIYPIMGFSVLYFLVVLLGAYRMNAKADLWTKFGLTIGWRPFVNIKNVDLLLNKYDNFLYGYGYWIDLYVLMPGYSPNLGTWLKEYMGLSFDGGSITATIIGEAYVNFGYYGVYLYPLLVTTILLFFALYQKYTLFKKNGRLGVNQITLFLLVNVGLSGIVSSGITSVFLYVIIPLYLVYYLDKILVNYFVKYGI